MATSRGGGRWSSAASTALTPKVPSGSHSMYRQAGRLVSEYRSLPENWHPADQP
jgi:hypothetical protein